MAALGIGSCSNQLKVFLLMWLLCALATWPHGADSKSQEAWQTAVANMESAFQALRAISAPPPTEREAADKPTTDQGEGAPSKKLKGQDGAVAAAPTSEGEDVDTVKEWLLHHDGEGLPADMAALRTRYLAEKADADEKDAADTTMHQG